MWSYNKVLNLIKLYRYDEELAQSDLLSLEARTRIGTGGAAARGGRDAKKPTATWK